MTVLDALKLSVDKLDGISVPVKFAATISKPISEAVAMINATIEALSVAEAAQDHPEDQERGSADESESG